MHLRRLNHHQPTSNTRLPGVAKFCRRAESPCKAYSLVEVLVVVGIIAVLSVTGVSVVGTTGGRKVDAGATKVSTYALAAREAAVNGNTVSALVIRTLEGAEESALRAMAVFKLVPRSDGAPPETGDWEQVSRWETLPTGIVIDPDPSNHLLNDALTSFSPSLPASVQQLGGGPFRVVFFRPDGSVINSRTPVLRVIEGSISNGGLIRRAADGNSRDIAIVASSGRPIFFKSTQP